MFVDTPATGKMVEYKMPVAFAEPYDIWPDMSKMTTFEARY
jgi:hypothetical protein